MISERFKRKFIYKIIPAFIFFGSFIVIVFITERQGYYLRKNHKYTIGKAEFTWRSMAVGIQLKYSYRVNGSHYTSSNSYNEKCKVPGRYYIKYSVKNPGYSEILQDNPVSDSIKDSPSEGWLNIPE